VEHYQVSVRRDKLNKKTSEIYQRKNLLPRSSSAQHEGTKLTTFDNGKNKLIASELYDDAVFMLNCIKGNLQLLKDTPAGSDMDALRQKLQKDFDFCARNLAEAAPWFLPAHELLVDEICPLARAYQFKIDSYKFAQNIVVVIRKKEFVKTSPTLNTMYNVAGFIGLGFFGSLSIYLQEKLIPEDAPNLANNTPN
jgi:hypothetical protein